MFLRSQRKVIAERVRGAPESNMQQCRQGAASWGQHAPAKRFIMIQATRGSDMRGLGSPGQAANLKLWYSTGGGDSLEVIGRNWNELANEMRGVNDKGGS